MPRSASPPRSRWRGAGAARCGIARRLPTTPHEDGSASSPPRLSSITQPHGRGRMKKALLFALALATCGSANAIGIGVKAGTTGVGIDLAKNVAPLLDLRVGYSALKWGYDTDANGVKYDGDLTLSNLNTLLDFHPLGPVFRLTGGFIFNRNKYEAVGHPSSGPGSFNAKVESGRTAAPYLGVGWGNVAGAGLNFYADLGVMFMGEPKATISADCTGFSATPQCSALQAQTAQQQADLQDRLKRFKAWPVLTLGIT